MRFPVLVILILLWPRAVCGQDTYSVSLQGVRLSSALDTFSVKVGKNVAFASDDVVGLRAFCVAVDLNEQALLKCILRVSGLSFLMRPSGTYLIVEKAEQQQRGRVYGRVVNHSGQPLPSAHVSIGSQVFAVTNQNGWYAIGDLLPGDYSFKVSYIGYATHEDTVTVLQEGSSNVEVTLDRTYLAVEPLIINGSKNSFAHAVSYAEVSDSQIRGNEPLTSVGNTLRATQLIAGISPSTHSSDIHLHGGSAGDHRIIIDGSPVLTPPSILGAMGPFSTYAFKRISVHKTGFGPEHGSHLGGLLIAEHNLLPDNGDRIRASASSTGLESYVSGKSRFGSYDATAMAAIRISNRQPSTVSDRLNEWSANDGFLVDAAKLLSESGTIGSTQHSTASGPPDLDIRDIHLGIRLTDNSSGSITASSYMGSQGLFASQSPASFKNLSRDDYHTSTNSFSVKIARLLGPTGHGSLTIRHTGYHFTHHYQLVDTLFADFQGVGSELEFAPITDTVAVKLTAADIHTNFAVGKRGLVTAGASLEHQRATTNAVASNSLSSIINQSITGQPDTLTATRKQIFTATDHILPSLHLQYGVTIGRLSRITLGSRITYQHFRKETFWEPRLALETGSSDGRLSAAIRTGVYRQYIFQDELPTANSHALLPLVRIWLPLDDSVSPMEAYHVSTNIGWVLSPRSELSVEAWHKWIERSYELDSWQRSITETSTNLENFLRPTEGAATGASVLFASQHKRFGFFGRAEWSRVTRKIESQPSTSGVPWNIPFRTTTGFDANISRFSGTIRLTTGSGRSWGFRRIYYTQLGALSQEDQSRFGYDFSRPDRHKLPATVQLDLQLGALVASTRHLELRASAQVLNALGRRNVLEWRLEYDDVSSTFRQLPLLDIGRTAIAKIELAVR